MQLLVNIDHVATLRNARGEDYPDPTEAAIVCEQAGAAGIVFHLRSDRRHIRDDDVFKLKRAVRGVLDFEMAATDEMIQLCKEVNPHLCTLVPEGREELTTEGGLDMKQVYNEFENRVMPAFEETDIEVCLFLDPNPEDIQLAHKLGVDAIELHTGTFANSTEPAVIKRELDRLKEGAILINELGMKVNSGHGLNLKNLPTLIEHVPHMEYISIGHALISQSIYWGLDRTVKEYLRLMKSDSNMRLV